MISAGELAARLGLELRGDGGLILRGAAALDDADVWDLGFVGAAKFFEAAGLSAAGCLVVPVEYGGGAGRTVIVSPQPRADFARALELLYPVAAVVAGVHVSAAIAAGASVDPSAEVGPNVVVEAGAVIGARVRLGPGCVVGRDAAVGEDSVLVSNVTLYPRVRIGRRCLLHAGAAIGADGFGFELQGGRFQKVPQVGIVVLGDDVEIGANSCVDRAALGRTTIGDGTKLDNQVHIGHNCRIGKHVVIAAQTGLAGGVTVGDYAILGGQVGVGDKARIESRAVVGSGAGILTSKIVRAGEPVWGTPARPLRQYLAQLATVSRLALRRKAKKDSGA